MISLTVSWATSVPGVSVVIPIAGITYTIPVMDVLLDVRRLHARYTDTIQLSDSYVFLVEKGVNDAARFSDDHFYSASLGKVEIVQFQDTFDRTCSFYRDFTEDVGFSDTQGISLGKPLSDGFQLSDLVVSQTSKPVMDGVGFGDSQFTKTVSPKHGDIVKFSDSFLLSGNSYCEVSYFAEDYAGVIRQV